MNKPIPDWVLGDSQKAEMSSSSRPESGELRDAERELAYALVCFQSGLDEASQKSLFEMVVSLLESSKSGSTCLPYDGEKWVYDSPKVVGRPGCRCPILFEEGSIFTERNYQLEEDLARTIRDRVSQKVSPLVGVESAFSAVKEHPTSAKSGFPLALSAPQWNAIRCAVEHRLSVISGGPGTGKTSIIVSLLRILVRLGIDPQHIVLAAPTGKAASRMNESIRDQLGRLKEAGPEDSKLREHLNDAQTLHRVLKYSVKDRVFKRDESKKIRSRFVIVDEASMIDLGLMKALFDALPVDCNIVLVGDARQLPSVEVGAVLRDLVSSRKVAPAVGLLVDSYRVKSSGSDILKAAADIDQGRVDSFFERCVSAPKFLGRGISILEESKEGLSRFLKSWFDREFMTEEMVNLRSKTFLSDRGRFSTRESKFLDRLFSLYGKSKILCATRVWETGTKAINTYLHQQLMSASEVADLNWVVGEPVLMTRNNYEQNLYNGEQGLVLFVKDRHEAGAKARPMIVFKVAASSLKLGEDEEIDVGYRAFTMSSFSRHLESAFAITTHKSQGSEFDDVAVVLPAHISKIVSRELIYTAITRARRSVIVLGSREVIEAGVGNSNTRTTTLGLRLDRVMNADGVE